MGMEPQGEQAQMDLRDWDGSSPPAGYEDESMTDADGADWPPIKPLGQPYRPGARTKYDRLEDLYATVEEDPYWDHLRQPGIRLVKGDGPESAETAKVFIAGEAPGAQENGEGRPFVGASGRVLDRLLGLAGLKREEVFITNVVKYRPPGNRTPTLAEQLHGREVLREEWRIIRPALTVCVGKPAHEMMHVNGGVLSIGQSRSAAESVPWPYPNRGGPTRYCVSIYHPAYGIRAGKRIQQMIEDDWESLGKWIKENPNVFR